MREAFVRNAADRDQVKEAEGKERRGRERELNDLRVVLATVQGRRFVWRYLTVCGIFQTSVGQEPHQTYYNEGKREVGLRFLDDINESDPDAYLLMLKESKLNG